MIPLLTPNGRVYAFYNYNGDRVKIPDFKHTTQRRDDTLGWYVFKFSDDHLWVMTNGREREEHFAEVTRGLNVSIEFIGLDLPHLGLQGPLAREALAPHCSIDIGDLRYFHFIPEQVKVGE